MYISKKAKVSKTTTLIGDCKIHDNVVIYGECFIDSCEIKENTTIWSSALKQSVIGKNCTVGPYAHIRENCHVEDNVRIGNFVELKNTNIGSGTKVAHLTYVGDANIGNNCNLGCGVVFCNYDGKQKHTTNIGNEVFVGSNVNLIAPITIEDRCFIAAGSTVTQNAPKNTFVIAREKQINKIRKD